MYAPFQHPTIMKRHHLERLMKLARFLHSELPRKRFDFSVVIIGKERPDHEYTCGAVGCSIGWMPHVFPRRFAFVLEPTLWETDILRVHDKELDIRMSSQISDFSIKDFFGLNSNEVGGLFVPQGQHLLGLPLLTARSTPKQVARNMVTFARRKAKELDINVNTQL